MTILLLIYNHSKYHTFSLLQNIRERNIPIMPSIKDFVIKLLSLKQMEHLTF
jgi:ABC-type uncharacterized transport system substrate-binding protein